MNYKIKSLGYRTDFIFNKWDGSVEDKGDFIVAKTASNPNYFWGNLLLFKTPPKLGDFESWKTLFLTEFNDPRIYHMTFGWDSPEGEEGDVSEFLANGFELEKSVVLCAQQVKFPPKLNSQVVVRPIDLQKYLQTCVDIQVSVADFEHLSKEAWRDFYLSSMSQYQKLIENGLGKWFGAFLDEKLVGSLGVFHENGVARFQIVSTHSDYLRRGVCSTLVYESAKYALEKMDVSELVMVADEEYYAAKIYESVGFVPEQKLVGVCWWDKSKT